MWVKRSDFLADPEPFLKEAETSAIMLTDQNGDRTHAVIPIAEYARLCHLERRVIRVADLTDEEFQEMVDQIKAQDLSHLDPSLDDELKDWKP